MKYILFIIAGIIAAVFLYRIIYSLIGFKRIRNMSDSHDLQDKIDELGDNLILSTSAIGLVMGVVQNGKAYIRGYGSISKDQIVRPDRQTIFEASSLSKIFTASLLQLFHDQGQLSRDDNIRKYICNDIYLPANVRDTKLINLATHTSGFPFMPQCLKESLPDKTVPYKYITENDIKQYLETCEDKQAIGNFRYSDFGIGLLGYILERGIGKKYETMVKEEICQPLNMTNTTITVDKQQEKYMALGYTVDKKLANIWQNPSLPGCSSFLSNADDMVKFIYANLKSGYSRISPSLQLTHQPYLKSFCTLGWHRPLVMHTRMGLKNILSINGNTHGHSCYLAIDESHQTGVIVFANMGSSIEDIGVKLMIYANHISFHY